MSDYDISIHCNCLDCRKIIYQEEKACVTSCSHIFCLECANVKFAEALVCPACESSLTQSNDIVLIELSPSEEYKTSILAGLSPTIIMDICNRALSFYNYQVSQELCYRQAMQHSLESQLASRQDRLEAVVRDHKRILQGEMKKIQALKMDNELEKRRNHDLRNEIQNKTIQFSKLQAMYDKLKRKTTGSMIQQSVQDQLSSVHPLPNDKHQTPLQPIQSPKPYAQPLNPNRQYQPPRDFIRNTMDSTKISSSQQYQPQLNPQHANIATNKKSPIYSPHRGLPTSTRSEAGIQHGATLNCQHPHRHHQQSNHHHQPHRPHQPQNEGWNQFPPPPPRNYHDTSSQIIAPPNHHFPM